MTALRLRRVNRAVAQVSRELGAGVTLYFTAHGLPGQLILSQIGAGQPPTDDAVALSSAAGPLRMSDAGPVLSLLGNAPVVFEGTHQAWYWQYVNQQLSAPIAALLAPIEPIEADRELAGAQLSCRLQVRLGEESVHAVLSASAGTLLSLLSSEQWQRHERDLPDNWKVPHPVVLGQVSLTLEQLRSLRPGDVLLPSLCHFDNNGNGYLHIAGQRWHAGTEKQDDRLVVRLGHEEHFDDGQ